MKPYFLLPLLLFAACKDGKPVSDPPAQTPQAMVLGETYVDTLHLHKQPFHNQMLCNGKLQAVGQSVLSFPRAGRLASLRVVQGQRVAKGAVIATQDTTAQYREVERALHELEHARITLADKLIGLGYEASLQEVPEDLLQRMEVATGYYSAKFQLQNAQTALAECTLRAPFAGRVANVEAKLHQVGEKVCTLIDDSQFGVEFKVLESELPHIHLGQAVQVSPFIDDRLSFRGTLREINPLVDEKGLVKVVARIAGGSSALMDGMNMRVVVEERVEEMFVVPKDAVIERDGYPIIFLLQDGKAAWTYVDIAHSNISSYAITGSARKNTRLHEGEVVITSGNLNLADGTEVRVRTPSTL